VPEIAECGARKLAAPATAPALGATSPSFRGLPGPRTARPAPHGISGSGHGAPAPPAPGRPRNELGRHYAEAVRREWRPLVEAILRRLSVLSSKG
jgi:hypothetical protein